MKRFVFVITMLAAVVLAAPPAMAVSDAEVAELVKELKALKARVSDLEAKLDKAQAAAQDASQAAMEARQTSANSLKMSQQLAKTKDRQPEGLLTEAGKRLKVYGAVELEGSYQNRKPKNGESTTQSDFTLSTAEIFFDATINKYTKGLLHLLYEQGDTDPINIDEAFILVGQTADIPAYFLGGRIYPAIGLFETTMVSDPITQNVFETQATAVEAGWAQDWFNIGVGTYNAGVHENGDGNDNTINTYYARFQFDAPEGVLGQGVDINAGIAYTNNIAGGNLGDEVVGQRVKDLVGGLSFMLNAQYKWVMFNAEYMTALDDYQAGELSFKPNSKAKPYAYNLELALICLQDWTFTARYEGSGDLGDFEPERQYGLTVSWAFLPDTTLSVEYLRGDYENDDERDLFTSQLAVAF